MSEQRWQDFLAAESVDDRVVLHGATAVFRVSSLRERARFAEAVSEIPALEGPGVMRNVSNGTLVTKRNAALGKHHNRNRQLVAIVAMTAVIEQR